MNSRRRFNPIAFLIFWIGANNLFGQSISSFSPWYGQPGDQVVIYGSGFVQGGTTVRFHGTVASATVTTLPPNEQITAFVPAGAMTGPISVQTGGSPYSTSSNFVVIGAGPYISDFSPGSGGSSTAITLNGTHFTGTTSVTIGGVNASFSPPTTDSQLLVTTPVGVLSGKIVVMNSSGTGTSSNNFYAPPTLTSFSPSSGHSGSNIVITGKNFLNASAVRFNGTDATSFVVNANTQITAVLPTNVTSGVVNVVAPGGQISSTSNFLVLPTISNFSPTNGNIGTAVTIGGTGFNSGTPVVKFGGTNAVVNTFSYSQITTTVPTNAPSGPISVTTSNGTDTGTIFYLPPGITSFSPPNGAAGTTVTVNGKNFTNASSVTFNDVNATTFHVVNNNQLTATVPATMTGPITIVTPGGTITASTNFFLPPSISSFTPGIAVVTSPITISGSSFTNVTAVKFNGTDAATFTVSNNSTISAVIPLTASSGTISVTAPGGTTVSANSLTIEALQLFIGRLTNNVLAISWTTNATGFALQNSDSLQSSNTIWTADPHTPFLLNGKNAVTNLPDGARKFYRLKK